MTGKFSLDDYIDVAERIQHFLEKYPEGSLQAYCEWKVATVGDQAFIVYTAAAYRSPEDHRPGIGTAWEPFPGRTPYTKDSELMNAETAAWGRAIVALGLTANRKIASRQEVQARQGGDTVQGARNTGAPTDKQLTYLKRLVTTHKPPPEVLKIMLKGVGAADIDPQKDGWSRQLTQDQVSGLIDVFKEGALPTGESDIPSDLPFEETAPA